MRIRSGWLDRKMENIPVYNTIREAHLGNPEVFGEPPEAPLTLKQSYEIVDFVNSEGNYHEFVFRVEETLTPEEFFILGEAYILFRLGDFDEAIHLTIGNETFRPLHEQYAEINKKYDGKINDPELNMDQFNELDENARNEYCGVILSFLDDHGFDLRKIGAKK